MQLVGGWGYNNLGDEVILAGYARYLAGQGGRFVIRSVDPSRTARAQGGDVRVISENYIPTREVTTLMCGGGYLNGNWKREAVPKLSRLVAMRGSSSLVVHGVEVRNLDGFPARPLARRLFQRSDVAVRDSASAQHLGNLGVRSAAVLPDGVALLQPHVDSYRRSIPSLRGKVLINLLDVDSRSDRHEAEFPTEHWRKFCLDLVASLGDKAVGLVIGGGDLRFLKGLGSLPLVVPTSVEDFVSAIGSAAGLFSVRMHPALVGSMLGTPTVSVPYCGKVRPTLSRIGIERMCLERLSVPAVRDALEKFHDDSEAWASAVRISQSWLDNRLDSNTGSQV